MKIISNLYFMHGDMLAIFSIQDNQLKFNTFFKIQCNNKFLFPKLYNWVTKMLLKICYLCMTLYIKILKLYYKDHKCQLFRFFVKAKIHFHTGNLFKISFLVKSTNKE